MEGTKVREQIKRASVLATVDKKYATELPKGRQPGSILAENWVVSLKEIIVFDLSETLKAREKAMGTSESLFQIHLSPRSSFSHNVAVLC